MTELAQSRDFFYRAIFFWHSRAIFFLSRDFFWHSRAILFLSRDFFKERAGAVARFFLAQSRDFFKRELAQHLT